MNPGIPIACNLDALCTDERRQRSSRVLSIREGIVAMDETDEGFRLRLNSDEALYRDALDRICLERRCCPFLDMKLVFSNGDGPVYLDIGGSDEVKAFLVSSGVLGCAE